MRAWSPLGQLGVCVIVNGIVNFATSAPPAAAIVYAPPEKYTPVGLKTAEYVVAWPVPFCSFITTGKSGNGAVTVIAPASIPVTTVKRGLEALPLAVVQVPSGGVSTEESTVGWFSAVTET